MGIECNYLHHMVLVHLLCCLQLPLLQVQVTTLHLE